MKHAAFLVVLLAVWVVPARAVTVVPITFEELVAESTAIVYARVSDVRGRWTADRRQIESVVRLQPIRYLKGDLGGIVMRLPGGEAGGMTQVLPGVPVLRAGDLAVLFLGGSGPAIPSPVGLTQGVFRVSVDGRSGAVTVLPPPLKASPAGRVIRGAADRRSLTLDAFAQEVAAVDGAAR
jgi:hypothetical protein